MEQEEFAFRIISRIKGIISQLILGAILLYLSFTDIVNLISIFVTKGWLISLLLHLVVFLIVLKLLMIKSHRVMRLRNLEYDRYSVFESDVHHGIKFKILEESIEEKIVIQILNVSNKNIKKIVGDIYLYRKVASKEFSKIRLQSIDFITTNLDESNGAVLAILSVTDRNRHWDGFEIFVREMETNNKVIKNEMIKGASFLRTYFRALNPQSFHDYRIFNMKVSYNLVYFKEKVKLLRSYILYLLKYRVYK